MTARILVVDDMPLNVKLLAAKLEHEYYVVTTATNGAEALAQIDREPPDLVLLDVMMPDMDGFEVCRQIRADAITAHLPVVMVTALTDVKDRVQGLQAGADDFLTKPINDLALMARVRSLLRLKTLMDEWKLREKTSLQFAGTPSYAEEPVSVSGSRILLLEENSSDRDFIEKTLNGLSAQVEMVSNVSDVASMARTGYYDLVFASLNLADEDALGICAQLRSNENTRHLPLVLIGVEDDMPRIARGLDLGANDYLLRPLDANELIARTRTQLRHKRHYDNLRKNYEASLALALVDALTGAFNRRYMEAHFPRMLARALHDRKEIAVLMIDIDRFKSVNDKHGHAAGDLVLKAVAERIQGGVRPSDMVARIGGEEFLVVMPETASDTAQMIAERLRTKIASAPVLLPDGTPLTVSVSIGCAGIDGSASATPEALTNAADKALYRAKETGRDRVVLAAAV